MNSIPLTALQQIVGPDHVSATRTGREIYAYDASLARGLPGVVVFPGTADEAARVVTCLHQARIPFVGRGFGTNLSGGTVLADGGAVVCMSRFNRILSIAPDRRCAVVQPGVTNLELQNALAPRGFFYAPDPASQKVATLGGNVGENSGGPRCVKYGVTTNHILGLEWIMPDGQVHTLGGEALDPPGYDLRGIAIGSEGTFGLVTAITVRILPQSEKVTTLLVVYDDVADAARTVAAIMATGIMPLTLEMMDNPIIQAVEDSYTCGYPRDAAAVLIIEVEGPPAGVEDQAQTIRDICLRHGSRAVNQARSEQERDRLWQGRRGAFGAVARLANNFLVNDCTVPRTKLPQALAQIAEITKRNGFAHGNVFHAGDGNLHPLLFFDARDTRQTKRVKQAGYEIMQACVALGGTISGEHGIGVEKLDAMHLIFTPTDLDAQAAVKKAFDPDGLLNPGKVLPKPAGPAETDEVVPANDAELHFRDHLRKILAGDGAIRPCGRGTHAHFGNRSENEGVSVSTTDLDAIIELDAANQTVCAGAGIQLKTLQALLAKHCQWLPVRPLWALQDHSLGGLAALGTCGPERMLHGAPRDLALGLRFIDARGRLTATGGRVIKNVSGYDMTRLFIGSAGTLGVITQLTLRTTTLPQTCIALTAVGTLGACRAAAGELMQTVPETAFVVSTPLDSTGAADDWQLAIGFEGLESTLEPRLEAAAKILERHGMDTVGRSPYPAVDGFFAGESDHWQRLAVQLRIDLPLHHPHRMLAALADRAIPADRDPAQRQLLVDWGCGRIWIGLEMLAGADWHHITRSAATLGGHAVVVSAPDSFRSQEDVFGPDRPEWRLMQRIKDRLDPDNRFNPGILPGRI